MQTVSLDDIDPDDLGRGIACRHLSEHLKTTGLAINHYRIPPGEGFPSGLHAHADQEEVFVVLDGEATFETCGATRDQPASESSDGSGDGRIGTIVTVGSGAAIRFAPGEFQSGRNDGDTALVALALGAPRDSDDVRFPLTCPACGHGELRLDAAGRELTFDCPACPAEHAPEPCPSCGRDGLRVALSPDRRVVVACRDCEETFETPPVRPA